MAPTEHDLLNVLACIDFQWYEIGLVLKVDRRILEGLRTKLDSNIVKLSDVIYSWITTTESHLITWKTVIDAIEGPVLENRQIANIIREQLAKLERGKLSFANFVYFSFLYKKSFRIIL